MAGADARARGAFRRHDVPRRPAERRHHYLALADGTPAGYIDCGTFDRCTVYGGEGPDGPIIVETIDAVTGSIAFVIAPELRGRGLGRAMIAAMVARPELRDVGAIRGRRRTAEHGIAPLS